MPFAVETLRTHTHSCTIQVRNENTSTSLDRNFSNMAFDRLEVFLIEFHADLEDASVPITDLDSTRTGASMECFNGEQHPPYAVITERFPCNV